MIYVELLFFIAISSLILIMLWGLLPERFVQPASLTVTSILMWTHGRILKFLSIIYKDRNIDTFESSKIDTNEQSLNPSYVGLGRQAGFRDNMIFQQMSNHIVDMLSVTKIEELQKILANTVKKANSIGVTFEQVLDAIHNVDLENNKSWH